MASAGQKNGYVKPPLMRELEVEYWSNKPIEATEHEMTSLFEEDVRVAAAVYRCSYCYPHQRKRAVRPRLQNGTFEDWVKQLHERMAKRRPISPGELANEEPCLDDNGQPIWLTANDLAVILRIDPKNAYRGLRTCRAKGVVADDFPLYYVAKPSAIPLDSPCNTSDSSVSTDTTVGILTVGSMTISVSTDTSPEDVQWVKDLRTQYNERLSKLRQEIRTEFENGGTRHGIYLLTKRTTSKKGKEGEEEEPTPPPADPPTSTSATGNGNSNGNGHATAVALSSDPETVSRFERWRAARNRSKKPVPDENLELRRKCYEAFAGYDPAEQELIIADTAARVPGWNAETKTDFIPDGLKQLRAQKWRTDPVQYVSKAAAAEEERMDFYRRAQERAIERDRRDGRFRS